METHGQPVTSSSNELRAYSTPSLLRVGPGSIASGKDNTVPTENTVTTTSTGGTNMARYGS